MRFRCHALLRQAIAMPSNAVLFRCSAKLSFAVALRRPVPQCLCCAMPGLARPCHCAARPCSASRCHSFAKPRRATRCHCSASMVCPAPRYSSAQLFPGEAALSGIAPLAQTAKSAIVQPLANGGKVRFVKNCDDKSDLSSGRDFLADRKRDTLPPASSGREAASGTSRPHR